jgi:hypothetical protein
MANVLGNEKREQIPVLGRLGSSLRRIEAETGVRRETASAYPRAAGIAVRPAGRWGRTPEKPAIEKSTDSPHAPATASQPRVPAITRSPQASACEPYREWIEVARARGRNARARLRRRLRQRAALREEAARRWLARGAPADRDRTGRGGAGRLRGCSCSRWATPASRPACSPGSRAAGSVEVEGAYYHLPPGLIGRRVLVQWDALQVRMLDPRTGALVQEHVHQSKGGRRMRGEDRPRTTPPSTQQLLERAARAGAHIGALCHAIHRQEGELGLQRIQGVLALIKRSGTATVDQVCADALALELPSYRSVRRALERGPAPPFSLKQIDPLIRQLTHYRDPVDRLTQGDPP